jgi:hypothetical protein
MNDSRQSLPFTPRVTNPTPDVRCQVTGSEITAWLVANDKVSMTCAFDQDTCEVLEISRFVAKNGTFGDYGTLLAAIEISMALRKRNRIIRAAGL